jgi:NADPH-dependent curcumin reductase
MPPTNRQWRLAARPTGLVSRTDLQLVESPVPAIRDGQALARVKYLSMDPTMRMWMTDIPMYMPPVVIGEVMRAFGLAEIVDSRHPDFQIGDKVTGLTGLQDYVVINGNETRSFQKLPSVPLTPDTLFLSLLGITGLTAYFGMELAQPKSGETLVVSAAAGATGSVAGQIGKIQGCRVIGIAGTPEKCQWLTNDLGFDAAINYKDPDWREQIAAASPKGIDINYENVGGPVMLAVLDRMNIHGRVILCGLISGYTKGDPALASLGQILIKRLRVQGFIVIDYASRFHEAARQLGAWKVMGKLKDRQTVVTGFDKVPNAINMLFRGENIGKLLVEL